MHTYACLSINRQAFQFVLCHLLFNPFREGLTIAPEDATCGTHRAAGGCLAVPLSFITEVALKRKILIIVELHGPERTSLHTGLATDTKFIVDKHDTLIVPCNSLHRTGLLAGGICTVVTIDRFIIGRFFNHPYQSWAYTEPVLLLACHFTGMATHAVFLKKNQRDFPHLITS
jgi:hypothetical protein